MDIDRMHKMLSFGYNDKVDRFGEVKPIGRYGNGFKSGAHPHLLPPAHFLSSAA